MSAVPPVPVRDRALVPDDALGEGASPFTPVMPRGARPSSRRRWLAGLVVLAALGGIVLAVLSLLSDAALFFYNADEAVARRDELGSQRFTVQGTPLAEAESGFWDDRPVIAFSIGFDDAVIDVVHQGDPPELFQPGVPVVLEGAWRFGPGLKSRASDGWHFASDRMLVKHDNDYRNREDFQERVNEAERGGSGS